MTAPGWRVRRYIAGVSCLGCLGLTLPHACGEQEPAHLTAQADRWALPPHDDTGAHWSYAGPPVETIRRGDGSRRHYVLQAEPGHLSITGSETDLLVGPTLE